MGSSHDTSTPVSQIYKAALGAFINKQFAEAVNTLEPVLASNKLNTQNGLSSSNWIRLWNLYIAILIRACEQEEEAGKNDSQNGSGNVESGNSPMSSSQVIQTWTDDTRLRLAQILQSNGVWDQVEASASELHDVPPQLLVTLLASSLKHSNDLSFVARKVEAYLVSTGHGFEANNDAAYTKAYLHVLEIYAAELLPREGEFDLALEFIQMNVSYPESQKLALISKIQDAKVTYLEQAHARKEETIRREKARLEQARKDRELSEKAEALRIAEREKAAAQKPTPKKKASSDVTVGDSQKESMKPSSSYVSAWSNLRNHWSSSLHKVVNYSTLTKYLFPLACFLMLVSRPAVRQKVRGLLVALWLKVAQTFSMGMKVSYV